MDLNVTELKIAMLRRGWTMEKTSENVGKAPQWLSKFILHNSGRKKSRFCRNVEVLAMVLGVRQRDLLMLDEEDRARMSRASRSNELQPVESQVERPVQGPDG